MQAGRLKKALAGLVFATGMVVPAAAMTALPAHAQAPKSHFTNGCTHDGVDYADGAQRVDDKGRVWTCHNGGWYTTVRENYGGGSGGGGNGRPPSHPEPAPGSGSRRA